VLFKNYIFKFKIFPALIFAITFCGFIVLGFWQIDRADQKNTLNSNYTDRQQEAAIVLDKKVHMAPSIREKISQGGTQIEGFADINEAKDIAIVLRAGALPAPVNILEERIVGPSLGADSVKKGAWSVLVGLALVLIFMLFYYKIR